MLVARQVGSAMTRLACRGVSTHTGHTWVATCGNGDFGRLGHGGTRTSQSYPTMVQALNGLRVKQVACGGAHTCAVTEDGRVLSWGMNDQGQLGHSAETDECETPQEVTGMNEPVEAVATGHYHTLCLTKGGNVWAFGSNSKGQLGVKSAGKVARTPVWVRSLKDAAVVRIAGGPEHSLACADDGSLYAWGATANGRLGHGNSAWWQIGQSQYIPRLVSALKGLNVVEVVAGHMHSLCVDADGKVYSFGYGRFHQLGRNSDSDQHEPMHVKGIHGVRRVACGGQHNLAVNSAGRLLTWGAAQNGSLGLGLNDNACREPTAIAVEMDAVQVACGWKHSAAVTTSGRLLTWGWGGSMGTQIGEGGCTGGQLGLGDVNDRKEPQLVEDFDSGRVLQPYVETYVRGLHASQVACGFNHTAMVVQTTR